MKAGRNGTEIDVRRYRGRVGTNLRLPADLAEALRAEAGRTGRSQQEILRHALAKELGMVPGVTPMERAVHAGLVQPPTPYEQVIAPAELPQGMTTMDLLDRDDR